MGKVDCLHLTAVADLFQPTRDVARKCPAGVVRFLERDSSAERCNVFELQGPDLIRTRQPEAWHVVRQAAPAIAFTFADDAPPAMGSASARRRTGRSGETAPSSTISIVS